MTASQTVAPRPVTPLSIMAANLAQLQTHAQRLGYADRAFAELLAQTSRLAEGLDPYLEDMTTPASPALIQLAADTAQRDWTHLHALGATAVPLEQEMLSGHVEGRLLNVLVRATQAKRILEIGLFTGYSALAMAEALPADGYVLACELDAYAAGVARESFDRSPHGRKIRIEIGPAIETLESLRTAGETFDFVFIDADKDHYSAYLDCIVGSTLLTTNGLICVDNTLMQGEPYLEQSRTANGAAIEAFNRDVTNDPRIENVILPIRDGLTLIRRAATA